jgi:hypothetical protein
MSALPSIAYRGEYNREAGPVTALISVTTIGLMLTASRLTRKHADDGGSSSLVPLPSQRSMLWWLT